MIEVDGPWGVKLVNPAYVVSVESRISCDGDSLSGAVLVMADGAEFVSIQDVERVVAMVRGVPVSNGVPPPTPIPSCGVRRENTLW